MSWNPLLDPGYPDDVGMDSIETLIVPRSVDVNPLLRRVLPAPQRSCIPSFSHDAERPGEGCILA